MTETAAPVERLTALAGGRLAALRDRIGRGFGLDAPQARLVVDVAIAGAKQPNPSLELVEALLALVRAR